MKRVHLATIALLAGTMCGLAAQTAAGADSPFRVTMAKVREVAMTSTRSNGYGTYVMLTVSFDQAVGACGSTTQNQVGVYQVYLADPSFLITQLALEGMRQLAASALLSGRGVRVQTEGCADIHPRIDSLQLQ